LAFTGKKGGGVAHDKDDILKMASEIVAAYVRNNPVSAAELPAMIKSVHATLSSMDRKKDAAPVLERAPAVPVKKSVTADHIVCLEDGKKLKMLKRYLRARYGLTPDAYRAKWNLPADYPMVAPNYANRRSELAKKIGLGRGELPSARRRKG
jgi:predicted transcriptional regulator